MIPHQKIQSMLKLLDEPDDGPFKSLKFLVEINWNQSKEYQEALVQLFQREDIRKRIIYFGYSNKLDVSLLSIHLIKQISKLSKSIITPQEKLKIMGLMFHKHEEVRIEGITVFLEKLQMKDKEISACQINLDEIEVNQVFTFKENPVTSIRLLTKFLKEIYSVDRRIYEKEELVEYFIESIGFRFGPLFDFNQIFTLLIQLPDFKLKDKIYDFLRLMIVILKKTMKFLAKIQSKQKISDSFTLVQQEKLLLIRHEYFSNLLNSFPQLRSTMQSDIIFNKYLRQLFLFIPPQELSSNLKESIFSPFAKAVSEDLFLQLTKPSLSCNRNHMLKEMLDDISVLQHFLQNTPPPFDAPFLECKNKILQNLIIEPTDRLHKIIVQEQNDENDNIGDDKIHNLAREYEKTLFLSYALTQKQIKEIEMIFSEKYIKQSLELTDAIISSSSPSSPQALTYSYATLIVQIDFYLNILRLGLKETYQSVEKFKQYMRYRFKLFKQLWSFLREERKKSIESHLIPTEYRKILYKSYLATIEALNFLSNQTLSHLPIFMQLQSDDPLFFTLSDYVDMFCKQPIQMVKGSEKIEYQSKIEEDQVSENLLAPFSGVADMLLIISPFFSLVKNNWKYATSYFSIYILSHCIDHENKKVIELLQKILGSLRLKGENGSIFSPFWKVFDKVMTILQDQNKIISLRKFVTQAHRVYFTDIDSDENTNQINHMKELCERQIYYLTTKIQQVVNYPEKLQVLDTLGYLLSLKIKWPKNSPKEEIEQVQQLKIKYHSLFLKKVQDAIKERSQNIEEIEDGFSITSKNSKILIQKYLKRLQSWSEVRFNVDPFKESYLPKGKDLIIHEVVQEVIIEEEKENQQQNEVIIPIQNLYEEIQGEVVKEKGENDQKLESQAEELPPIESEINSSNEKVNGNEEENSKVKKQINRKRKQSENKKEELNEMTTTKKQQKRSS